MITEIANKIDNAGIIAVLVIDKAEHAIPLAEALLKGGVSVIELTLRTPAAFQAARTIKKELDEILLGIGTVLTQDQLKEVIDLGADFAVSPGYNPKIVKVAQDNNFSFAPGIMTPSELELAIEQKCRILKFFPAQTSGGLNHLESMSAPYQHLGLKFIPLGGINRGNASTYLQSSLITAIGGSWIAKRSLIQNEDWNSIKNNAIEITELIRHIRNNK